MKKYIKYISAAALVATLASSCTDENSFLYTSSPSTFDEASVYSNYQLSEQVIFGISESFVEVNSYRGRFLPWYGFNTDIEWYNAFKEEAKSDDKTDFGTYHLKTSNTQMNTASNGVTNNPWALMYMAIERANLAIKGIRQYGGDAADMKYLLGEALTLRAMVYYDLIKAWGDVPARFEPVSSATIYVPRSNRNVIYKQILKDLEEAFAYLPYPGQGDLAASKRTDRINKAFAQGLYARIALQAAGKALRVSDDLTEITSKTAGENREQTDPELVASVLYPKALGYLQEAIKSSGCGLEDFEQYWRNQNNLANLVAGSGLETLYVIPFGDNRGRWNFSFALYSESGSKYNPSGSTTGANAGPVPTVFFMYDDNDVRRDVTCANYKWCKDGSVVPSGIGFWSFGKYRFEWMEAQPFGGGNDDGVKPVVMRYADILLMAAEIDNKINNGPTSFAKECFKKVRARACGEDAAELYVNAVSGSYDSFFSAIKKERALEFCGEFLRKADLIRWGELKSSMDETVKDLDSLRIRSGKYAFLQDRTDIYYRFDEDAKALEIYGLKKGENEVKKGDWTKVENYITDSFKKPNEGLGDNRIKGIYFNNPDEYMYWPVFDCNISDSQQTLVNCYNY